MPQNKGIAMDETEAKDRLLLAMLPDVAFDGWSLTALRAGARSIGLSEAEALAMFPRGPADMVQWFSHWADREMLNAIATEDFTVMRTTERLTAAIGARLAVLAPYREAARRAAAVLALPPNLPLGARLLYDTVDAAWYAAGDTATDFNFYSKRALLAGAYGATLVYWFEDRSPGSVDSLEFLRRRLADVMALPRVASRLRAVADRLPNPLRLFRAAQRR
jgi:ubiquinone biosynthesis protein COQ9